MNDGGAITALGVHQNRTVNRLECLKRAKRRKERERSREEDVTI